jgi:fructose-1-phosphate kinase PfkB-like protein
MNLSIIKQNLEELAVIANKDDDKLKEFWLAVNLTSLEVFTEIKQFILSLIKDNSLYIPMEEELDDIHKMLYS